MNASTHLRMKKEEWENHKRIVKEISAAPWTTKYAAFTEIIKDLNEEELEFLDWEIRINLEENK
jgi:hypothetical protein